MDVYIVLRSKYFNEVCFKNDRCPMNCQISTKLFLVLCYYFWRFTVELNVFYVIIFLNSRLKANYKLFALMMLLYCIMLPIWFFVMGNIIDQDSLIFYFDITFISLGFLIFLPILHFKYRISLKFFLEINKFQFCFILIWMGYLIMSSNILTLQGYFQKNFTNGSNYFRILVATFCVLLENVINFIFTRLVFLFKSKNMIIRNRFILKIFAQGLFSFTNSLQVGVLATSTFHDWGLYYQFALTIYANINLMSNNYLMQKIFYFFIKSCCNFLKRFSIGSHSSINFQPYDDSLTIFIAQKIVCFFVIIPRITFLFCYKNFCSPLSDGDFISGCFSKLSGEMIINYVPIFVHFLIEISIIGGFYFYMSRKQKHRLMKCLFDNTSILFKVPYYMSFQAIYESWLWFFLIAQ